MPAYADGWKRRGQARAALEQHEDALEVSRLAPPPPPPPPARGLKPLFAFRNAVNLLEPHEDQNVTSLKLPSSNALAQASRHVQIAWHYCLNDSRRLHIALMGYR